MRWKLVTVLKYMLVVWICNVIWIGIKKLDINNCKGYQIMYILKMEISVSLFFYVLTNFYKWIIWNQCWECGNKHLYVLVLLCGFAVCGLYDDGTLFVGFVCFLYIWSTWVAGRFFLNICIWVQLMLFFICCLFRISIFRAWLRM